MAEQIALLFPGQGSQYVGMGRQLLEQFRVVRDTFQEASDVLGEDMARLCLEGPEERLRLTANAQPAILSLSVATFRLLEQELGLRPTCAAGHSLGEYSALVAAGAMAFKEAVLAVRRRGQFMQEAVPEGQGAMAAILGLDSDEVDRICREMAGTEVVVAANYNGPGQVVVSGHASAVERVGRAARQRGAKKVVGLPVSAPFHSPLLAPAGERLRSVLEGMRFQDPAFPVISNVDAAPYPPGGSMVDILARQVSRPVRWEESMRLMASWGTGLAVEVGPKKVLVGLLKRIAPELRALQVEDAGGLQELARALD
jgi:[acyl-carrier-protein] S-malonyltransferase